MSDAVNVVPHETEVSTGVTGTDKVAKALTDVVSDTYRLIFKTHAYHWNVEGPLFYSVHKLTEEQYEDMFKAVDDLAERCRALGQFAPMNIRQIVSDSAIEDVEGRPGAAEMVEDLAKDHERVAKRMHALQKIAEEHRDIVTDDLAADRSSFHEQAAWMLRAIAA